MPRESCDVDLDLRASDGSERGKSFLNVSQVEMKFSVERQWIKAVRKAKRKPNYGTSKRFHPKLVARLSLCTVEGLQLL